MNSMHIKSSLSIAPMIDWSYTHFRVLMRLLAPSSLIFTEMQTTGAIEHNPNRALYYSPIEQPLALQLGGSDPMSLAQCAIKAEQAGYQEVNLNLGCPSDKVQSGRFGACLMADSTRVSQCIKAMKEAVGLTVSAKTRIGIDDQDDYKFFSDFIHKLVEAGVDKVFVHARKAWLKGLNPKQNRTIPPVNYDFVYRIKQELPNLPVVINGNISRYEDIKEHLKHVDGVMLGRLACQNPFALAFIHDAMYKTNRHARRSDLIGDYLDYITRSFQQGERLSLLFKPIFNYAHGLPGASQWKKKLMQMMENKTIKNIDQLPAILAEMEMTASSKVAHA